MSNMDGLNQEVATINASETTLLSQSGTSFAKDSIAQSKALAAQDIVQFMRQTETVSSAAIAACTELLVAYAATDKQDKMPTVVKAIEDVSGIIEKASASTSSAAKNMADAFKALQGGDS